jgi:hypothetical protein
MVSAFEGFDYATKIHHVQSLGRLFVGVNRLQVGNHTRWASLSNDIEYGFFLKQKKREKKYNNNNAVADLSVLA